jgi:hypothetical protein
MRKPTKRQMKKSCRWLDSYFGDVCRNQFTHPSRITVGGAVCFIEPPCEPCDGCGYEPITKDSPAWDNRWAKVEREGT